MIVGKGRIHQVIAGLQVLAKYMPDTNPAAEHDEIFCEGPPPEDLTVTDRQILENANWRWDAELPSWAYFT